MHLMLCVLAESLLSSKEPHTLYMHEAIDKKQTSIEYFKISLSESLNILV